MLIQLTLRKGTKILVNSKNIMLAEEVIFLGRKATEISTPTSQFFVLETLEEIQKRENNHEHSSRKEKRNNKKIQPE